MIVLIGTFRGTLHIHSTMSENIVHQWRPKVGEDGLMISARRTKVSITIYPYPGLRVDLGSLAGPRLLPGLTLGLGLWTPHIQPPNPGDPLPRGG
jgi:hypothetical protein